jgi:6-pyruvoyl-tetrahydropterin synthase related domain
VAPLTRPPRPWQDRLALLASLAACAGVLIVVVSQLHPNLLVSTTLTTGGDTGAHVALPAFMKAHLLPWHLTGWDPGWYDGFPLYTYYFVLPDLFAALGAFLIPYTVAFKLATILGSVLMPFCAWGMGRLFRLRDPIPAALAVATLPFLFDTTFTIDGGNLFSTLAGEYAFSLSLALSFLVIGLFARGVREGKGSVITPIAMAACLASHVVPFLFAVVGCALVVVGAMLPGRLLRGDDAQGTTLGLLGDGTLSRRSSLLWAGRTALLGFGLASWWLVPFVLGQRYTNPMGYVNDTDYVAKLFPRADLWVVALAVAALVLALRRQSLFGLLMSAQALLWGAAFVLMPQGALWNERLLPLWFISLYLLAGWVVGTALGGAARWWRRDRLRRAEGQAGPRRASALGTSGLPGAVAGPLVALALGLAVVLPPIVPGLVPSAALAKVGIHVGGNEVSSWAAWNYSGYEAKPAYPEFKAIMTTMARQAAIHGCGRAMWEYNSSLNRFGTPMALMLLPYYTNDCVGSQEGLFFESTPTVAFHFLVQAEVSVGPSDPQVGLPYGSLDVKKGVEHLQMLGVKYLMLSSPEAIKVADALPSLEKLTTIGPYSGEGSGVSSTTWSVYLIKDAPLVAGLSHLPVVVPGIDASADSWKQATVPWFEDPSRWAVPLAASGPASWPRGTAGTSSSPSVPVAQVSQVRAGTSSIAFRVDRLGTPVVVKASYYPRWHVAGAEGPYRISPNLMVVVPTSHDVVLTYGMDAPAILGSTISALSIAGLVATGVVLRRRRRGAPTPS